MEALSILGGPAYADSDPLSYAAQNTDSRNEKVTNPATPERFTRSHAQ